MNLYDKLKAQFFAKEMGIEQVQLSSSHDDIEAVYDRKHSRLYYDSGGVQTEAPAGEYELKDGSRITVKAATLSPLTPVAPVKFQTSDVVASPEVKLTAMQIKLMAARKSVKQASLSFTVVGADVQVSLDTETLTLTASDGSAVPDGTYDLDGIYLATVAEGVVVSFTDTSGTPVDVATLTPATTLQDDQLSKLVISMSDELKAIRAYLGSVPTSQIKQSGGTALPPRPGNKPAPTETIAAQIRREQAEYEQARRATNK